MNLTLAQLKERFPNASASFINANLKADNQRTRPCAIVQKQKAGDLGQQDWASPHPDRAKNKAVDESLHPQFCVSVVVTVSDNRRRDLDGMLATILDCVCAARRLLAGNLRN